MLNVFHRFLSIVRYFSTWNWNRQNHGLLHYAQAGSPHRTLLELDSREIGVTLLAIHKPISLVI